MLHKFIKYLLKNQVILALFLVALVWSAIEIRGILLALFFSYILMAAILPSVDYLRKKKFPKVFAVIIPFSIIILCIFLLVFPLVPFVVAQIQLLFRSLPEYLNRIDNIIGISINADEIGKAVNGQLNAISRSALEFTTRIFGGLFSFMSIFIISFYLLMYYDSFKKSVAKLFPPDKKETVLLTIDHVNEKLGAWLRGQVVLSVFIGLLTYIVLIIFNIPHALPLALLAGILEVVPTLGPILSAIPAIILALTISPTMAFIITIAYGLIQILENNVLVPNIMQKAVGLNPVIVILSILIGSNLMGIAGALLAIPFVSFVIVIFRSIATANEVVSQ